ncbi:cell envelope integrity protein TolA [Limnohabitans sp. Hippo3]|uniref:cell envelope integrity protein TolA n=1 Tax=Limnohabitans sp. Hippo3 TaxID=1597956 RepID=UPI000D3BD3FC|nr:cell envelope integrity protein TolA [Limnohabitans sp. Hippo3]PUE43722.1 protein TolA [Limnohabitans sp. Hippo3]
MNAKATPHLEFAPPAQPGAGRAWVVAGVAHALLFLAPGLATAWKTQPQTVQAEAELWSATPQAAAPKLQEPPPEPDPEPQPAPKPEPVKPTPPQPDPALERRDAQIALEKQKQLDKKKEAEKAEKLKAEREKAAQEKAKAEKEKAETRRKELEKEKLAKEKKAQEEKERDKKKAAEKAKADKADAARADALRQENLKRMQGMAGASGGENATGTALKSSGPSASYAGRLVGRIKPNITYPGDVVGNPRAEVEVKVSPDGTILSRRIVQTSGNKAWDDAVLRAIDKTEVFPKDSDGRVPPVIVLGFRPLD